MPAHYDLTIVDYDGESSTTGVWGATINAGNYTAQVAAAQAFRDALEAVSLGTLRKETLKDFEIAYDDALPTDPFAQTGTKWLVRARETGTGNAVTFKVPCADLSLLAAGSENMDISGGAGAAFVTAIEAYVKSNDGNAVTVSEIVYAG